MVSLPRAIQGVIIWATVFGVVFLFEVSTVLPAMVFDFIAFGWALFVVDSILTFVRPRVSFYLGLVLAAVALFATLSQPAHYQLIANGDVPATVTIIIGSATEVLLMVLVAYFALSQRGKDPWEWPRDAAQS